MSVCYPLTEGYDPTLSREAELAVLGAALQSPDAALTATSDLDADDFYSQQHQLIFETVCDLINGQEPVDEILVIDRLRESDRLEAAGGASYVSSLIDDTPNVANVQYYVGLVKKEAHNRRIQHAANRLVENPGDTTAQKEMESRLLCPYYAGPGLEAIDLNDFFSMEIPTREYLVYPWLRIQDLVMIHAWRGVGKTMLAAGVSWAIASGTEFLRWKAPEKRGVLYVDGELPADLLRDRFLNQQSALGFHEDPMIKILSHELVQHGFLTLATPEGRKHVERLISDEISVVVFDNLSCLYGGEENDAEGWQEMQDFLLRLRRRGIACVVIHHSGKGGQQRGTSRREDVLDTVINLKHPNGYKAEEGARFEIHFEKARGLSGDEVEPFEAHLTTTEDGHPVWVAKSLHPEKDRALELMREGLGDEEIGKVVSKDRSTINRWRNDFKKSGVL